MPPLYEYECPNEHRTTHVAPIASRPTVLRCAACGKRARRVMSLPVLHTLGEFSATIKDEFVQRSRDPGDGSYCDPNLGVNPETGQHTRIRSKRHREQLMAEAGLFEKPLSDKAKEVQRDRQRQAVSFSS